LWGAGLTFRLSIWKELQRRNFKNFTVGREGKSLSAGEDTELCYAIRLLGYSLYYDDDLVLQHYMPSVRMNWRYLEKMSVGFGRANVRLNCYRVLLPEGPVMKHWTREWLYALHQYNRNLLAAMYSNDQKEKWRKKVSAAYFKGMMIQLWSDKSSLEQMIKQVKATFPAASLPLSHVQQVPEANPH
jgi:hypothetical protein